MILLQSTCGPSRYASCEAPRLGIELARMISFTVNMTDVLYDIVVVDRSK